MPPRKRYADDEIFDPWLPSEDATSRRTTRLGQPAKAEIIPFDLNQKPAAFPSLEWPATDSDAATHPCPQLTDLERSAEGPDLPNMHHRSSTADRSRYGVLNTTKEYTGKPYLERTIVDWRYSNGEQNDTWRANVEVMKNNGAPPPNVQDFIVDGRVEGRDLSNFDQEMATSEEETTSAEHEEDPRPNWAQISPAVKARICENLYIYGADDEALAKTLGLTHDQLKEAIWHRMRRRQQIADENTMSMLINQKHLKGMLDASAYGDSSTSAAYLTDQVDRPSNFPQEDRDMIQRQSIVNEHFTELQNRYRDEPDYLMCKSIDVEKAKPYLLLHGLNPNLADDDLSLPGSCAPASGSLAYSKSSFDHPAIDITRNLKGKPSVLPLPSSSHCKAAGQSLAGSTQQLQTPGSGNTSTSPEAGSGSSRRMGLRDPQQRKKSRALEEAEAYESEAKEVRTRGEMNITNTTWRNRVDSNNKAPSSMSEDELADAQSYQTLPTEGTPLGDKTDEALMLPLKVKKKREGQAVLRKPKNQEPNREAVDQMRRNMQDVCGTDSREASDEAMDEMRRNMNERFKHQGAGARERDICSSSIPKLAKTYVPLSRHVFVQDGDCGTHLKSILTQSHPSEYNVKSLNVAPGSLESTGSSSPNQLSVLPERHASEDQHQDPKSHSLLEETKVSSDPHGHNVSSEDHKASSVVHVTANPSPPKAPNHKTSPRRGKCGRRCHACHKQKKGCDGKRPCERCSKTGRECVSDVGEDEIGLVTAPSPADFTSDPFVDVPSQDSIDKISQREGIRNEPPREASTHCFRPPIPNDVPPQIFETPKTSDARPYTPSSTIRVAYRGISLPTSDHPHSPSRLKVAQNNQTEDVPNVPHLMHPSSSDPTSTAVDSSPPIQHPLPNASKHSLSDTSIEGWQSESVEAAHRLKVSGIQIKSPKPRPPPKKTKLTKQDSDVLGLGFNRPSSSYSTTEVPTGSSTIPSDISPDPLQEGEAVLTNTEKPSLPSRTPRDAEGLFQNNGKLNPDEATEGNADDESARTRTIKPRIGRSRKTVAEKNAPGEKRIVQHPPDGNHTVAPQPGPTTTRAAQDTGATQTADNQDPPTPTAPAKVRLKENESLAPPNKRGRGRPKKGAPASDGAENATGTEREAQTVPAAKKKSLSLKRAGEAEGRIEID